uniref:lycopene beta-cyclase n=2 Tax=Chlamydomonas euryale TaxID=1486919 RepID=A0A7R9VJC8_9CHLO|mmetsp:Transcript_37139/g.109530  ORF Transcript_37139/g.109530 Transcript_37139/m.109530 type:complete len:308 (+) Transcript_37139:171-1094(+)
MLFMDWRDGHTAGRPEMKAANEKLPTFLYAMPFSKTKVFLEETSLVARPAIGFQELKERLQARMEHYGIKVTKIEEEEYCLIPMGGVLPTYPQRVLACGGTAGMVHPSTGFMMSQMLGNMPRVADAIVEQLSAPADKATDADMPKRPRNEAEADCMAERVWAATWPVERIRQRTFLTFGMELLLSLDLAQTRRFFGAFFTLRYPLWSGFLSLRLGFLQLIGFGLEFFMNSSNESRGKLLQFGVPGLIAILWELSPTLFPTSIYPTAGRNLREIKAAEDARVQQQLAEGAAPRTSAPEREEQPVGAAK